MADKKIKLEALTDNPPELAPAIAKKLNETAVAEGTKKKLLTMMGKPETDAKLLKETAAADAAADLKKFKEKVLDKPSEIVAVEAIRADVHDKILAALGGEFTAGADKYKIEDLDTIKAKFKKPDAPAPTPAAPTAGPQVAPSITTADSPPLLTRRNAAIAGSLAIGAPLVAAGAAGTASALGGGTFMGGVSTLGRTVGSLFAQPWRAIGGPALWNNIVVQPGNWLAGKLGIATGANATSGALAGMPGALGTTLGALGVAGGVYAGSKIINGVNGWVGGKMGYTPWKVPVIGGIPLIGSVANAAVAPFQFGLNGVGKVAGWGKQGLGWMFGKGKEAAAHRTSAAHFGLGALAGATILAPLTGGASLVWGLLGGHVARKGLKGKHFTDFVPAPFGVKKSAEGAAAH